jgi:type III pantothenate kinase
MPSFLLINLNNTSTKFALADEEKLIDRRMVPTKSVSLSSVKRALKSWKFDRVLLGSVVPKKTEVFRRLFRNQMKEVSPKLNLGIGISYPEPSKIGADRLANTVAVTARYGSPAIVVDFGTAVTFDIVSEKGSYQGGVIGPGLAAMTEYLHQRTALLPRIGLEELVEPPSAIGKTTRLAMIAGAVHGYRGLVRQILSEVVRELNGKVHIVATGSYADLIAAKLPELQIVDPDLTLDGLRIIALRNPL